MTVKDVFIGFFVKNNPTFFIMKYSNMFLSIKGQKYGNVEILNFRNMTNKYSAKGYFLMQKIF